MLVIHNFDNVVEKQTRILCLSRFYFSFSICFKIFYFTVASIFIGNVSSGCIFATGKKKNLKKDDSTLLIYVMLFTFTQMCKIASRCFLEAFTPPASMGSSGFLQCRAIQAGRLCGAAATAATETATWPSPSSRRS